MTPAGVRLISQIRAILSAIVAIAGAGLFSSAHADVLRATSDQWPIFRGDSQLTGRAAGELPDQLEVAWTRVLAESIESSAVIAKGTVFVGTDDSTVRALKLSDGSDVWTYKARDAVKAAPSVVGGRVFVGDGAGVVHAIDAASGKGIWTFETEGEIYSSVNPWRDRLIVGSYDGRLYCLDAKTGRQVWRFESQDRIHATPAITKGHALISGCDALLHRISLDDGKAVGKVELQSVCGASSATRGDRAWVGTYGNTVLGIDLAKGEIDWQFMDQDRQFPFMSSAALVDDIVIVGGRDKRVRGFRAADGDVLWTFRCGGRVDSSPVVAGGRVCFGATDGVVYVLDVRTGKEVCRFEAGGGILATPAVVAGRVVIATLDGAVYCLRAAAR